jgi:predicted AAA+ superfamily ATPase
MITSEKIREIIKTWQLEIRETKIFDREIYPYLKGLMKSDTPIVLHGIRRSGKTYLMYQLLQDTPEAIYVNFEDERFMGSDAGILEEIHQVI